MSQKEINIFFEKLVFKRFKMGELINLIQETFENQVIVNTSEEQGSADYYFTIEVDGFIIDIYYLKQPFGESNIFITEVGIEKI